MRFCRCWVRIPIRNWELAMVDKSFFQPRVRHLLAVDHRLIHDYPCLRLWIYPWLHQLKHEGSACIHRYRPPLEPASLDSLERLSATIRNTLGEKEHGCRSTNSDHTNYRVHDSLVDSFILPQARYGLLRNHQRSLSSLPNQLE